jgi:3-hydroxyisobutyrate dehydrogenase
VLNLGGEIAESPAALVTKVPIVFLGLFDSDSVSSVLTGKDGLVEGDCSEKIIVDTTTNHFESVIGFHELLRKRRACYLEAPVMGSVVPALQGNLSVLVSGDKKAFDMARPYIEKLGKSNFFLEEPGLATKMKLINNLILGSFMVTMAEALLLGEAVGLNKETALQIFSAGVGNSMVLNAKKEKLLKEDFTPHFSSAAIYKDLNYVEDLSKHLRQPLLTGSVLKGLYGVSLSEGAEALDFSVIYLILKRFLERHKASYRS